MPSFGQNIDAMRLAAIADVNRRAGAVRAKYYTDITGQSDVYAAKEAEAVRYIAADPEPVTLDEYPLIAREVGKTAPTAYEVAQVYTNKAAFWRGQLLPAFEDARIGAITTIEAATAKPQITQAVADFDTAMAGY